MEMPEGPLVEKACCFIFGENYEELGISPSETKAWARPLAALSALPLLTASAGYTSSATYYREGNVQFLAANLELEKNNWNNKLHVLLEEKKTYMLLRAALDCWAAAGHLFFHIDHPEVGLRNVLYMEAVTAVDGDDTSATFPATALLSTRSLDLACGELEQLMEKYPNQHALLTGFIDPIIADAKSAQVQLFSTVQLINSLPAPGKDVLHAVVDLGAWCRDVGKRLTALGSPEHAHLREVVEQGFHASASIAGAHTEAIKTHINKVKVDMCGEICEHVVKALTAVKGPRPEERSTDQGLAGGMSRLHLTRGARETPPTTPRHQGGRRLPRTATTTPASSDDGGPDVAEGRTAAKAAAGRGGAARGRGAGAGSGVKHEYPVQHPESWHNPGHQTPRDPPGRAPEYRPTRFSSRKRKEVPGSSVQQAE